VSGHVVALCGGVGGAKLAHGLSLTLAAGELSVIVNTGDDFRHLGLTICPDLDSVLYALAGLADPVRGWGRRDETWTFMAALKQLGGEHWFALGDADLAIHVERSRQLAAGASLTAVTAHFARALGIATSILPMSDDPVRTRLLTQEGWLEFQDYFVRQQCRPAVRALEYAGAASARANPAALAALKRADLRAVIICPSNPFLSVEPILALPALRTALEHSHAPVIAVTPIVGGKAVKGPAAKLMSELGLAVTGGAVAARYAGLIDAFVYEAADAPAPGMPGVRMVGAATMMNTDADRAVLAQAVLAAADAMHQAP
jgi:LPPG:FO 2-phospho-L-lactate transferase